MCNPDKLSVPPNNLKHECMNSSFNTLNSYRVPFISREILLVGNLNINERVETSPSREGGNELSYENINISEEMNDQFDANTKNFSTHSHTAFRARVQHPVNTENFDNIRDRYVPARDSRTDICEIENPENESTSENRGNLEMDEDPSKILCEIRGKNLSRPIIGHININFLESKFEALRSLIKDTLDVLVVTETKIDESYPTSQFCIDGFGALLRLDRNKHGGGVIIYVREHPPYKIIPFYNKPKDVEAIFFELTLRNKKWLIMGGYNPASETTSYFLDHVSKSLDKTMANYDNILILGDFNSTMSDVPMKNFCELYNLENLIKEPTCYKNPNNPSSIDVILTNNKNSFQNSMATETGLSDPSQNDNYSDQKLL